MSRSISVWREGKGVIPIEEAYEEGYDVVKPKVQINSDANFQMWHPVDNKIFTSKARFRAHTRAHGCEETGDAPPTPPREEFKASFDWNQAVKETIESFERRK